VSSDLDRNAGGPRHAKTPGRNRWIVEWALVLLAALGLAFALRTWVVQTYSIPSVSMVPTLKVGDRILVDKLSYHLHGVHRGDVVVFATPPKEIPVLNVKDLVKRVIGLPGETISSGPRAEVFISGKLIDQPWLTKNARHHPGPTIVKQRIPEGQIFVMGDNRGSSFDSRYFGTVPESLIVGRAVLGFWPLSRIHWI
jgi:signal peptidase I